MEILLKPLVTEKMTELSEKLNRVGFVVDRRATKIDIKRAVEKMYSVKVVSVNTMNYQGKTKSRFTKAGAINGRTVSFKKAIITLVEGDNIDFYSNI
ncbi:50S ribosomal protein L23 [Ancylomarina euxinus]|jgi:large subunit ribosomal protein L23|uniref:Large ribosomal subunit protein uL23 n=1 Tax=Ancylomarina euxinus TaxID=2283627 RepID=A0A425Y3I5_9BACT|nr:50S ribosomal protein L23 [Ancylomarina euxinus]MCZ4693124.1 50S ribosomal protein L23 [Ancylomarina euxinus]MUP15261.1 50S ribosomal protein L23 [Ancylomarina euxinus]RRG22609.1 50S ribosomal protein L23 [Ancylomarina euxinus]